MTATLLDSQKIADGFLEWVRQEKARLPFCPRLAAVLYRPTADAASVQYRDLILKDAARVGVEAVSLEVSSPEELKSKIESSSSDPDIHGIVVLYPLRCPVPDEEIMDLISPYKDAEGLHAINLGYLIKFKKFMDAAQQIKCVVPATPKAIVKSLQHYPQIHISGSFAVIINNSMRVGRPLGLMLENLGATVVKCYDKTRLEDMEHCVRRADILITAVPDPAFRLNPSWVKPGAAVMDVSYGGNIDAEALKPVVSLLTVPENRLGKVTRAMMFVNLIYCARHKGVYY